IRLLLVTVICNCVVQSAHVQRMFLSLQTAAVVKGEGKAKEVGHNQKRREEQNYCQERRLGNAFLQPPQCIDHPLKYIVKNCFLLGDDARIRRQNGERSGNNKQQKRSDGRNSQNREPFLIGATEILIPEEQMAPETNENSEQVQLEECVEALRQDGRSGMESSVQNGKTY